MQCQKCQYEVPSGTTFCPNCRTPITAPPAAPIPPTVFASPPNQGIAPTVAASMPNQPVPPTTYGESAPPPPPGNPYGTPSWPSYDPYSTPPAPPYAPQPMPYSTLGTSMPQQPSKNNGRVIAAVIVAIVVLVIGSGVVGLFASSSHQANNASATATANAEASVVARNYAAPTAPPYTGEPVTTEIDPKAAHQITFAQTASNVDANGNPTNSISDFQPGNTVYLSFKSTGNAGYAIAKLYRNSTYDVSSRVLQLTSGSPGGDFSFTINNTGVFTAGVYWCTQSNCSDAALAQVLMFNVL